jgi:hypothetical protein
MNGEQWSTDIVGVFYDNPPGDVTDIDHIRQMADSEIQIACDKGEFTNKPILDTHDSSRSIGVIRSVWREGRRWMVRFRLDLNRPGAAKRFMDIKHGKCRGLSLSHDLPSRVPLEISICQEPARPGCVIVQASKDLQRETEYMTNWARTFHTLMRIRMCTLRGMPIVSTAVPVQASGQGTMADSNGRRIVSGKRNEPVTVELPMSEEERARYEQIAKILAGIETKGAVGIAPKEVPTFAPDGSANEMFSKVLGPLMAQVREHQQQQQQQLQQNQFAALLQTNPAVLATQLTQQEMAARQQQPASASETTHGGDERSQVFLQQVMSNPQLAAEYEKLRQGQSLGAGPSVQNGTGLPALSQLGPGQSTPTHNSLVTSNAPPPATPAVMPASSGDGATPPRAADGKDAKDSEIEQLKAQLRETVALQATERFEGLWATYRAALTRSGSLPKGEKLDALKKQLRVVFDTNGADGVQTWIDMETNRKRKGRRHGTEGGNPLRDHTFDQDEDDQDDDDEDGQDDNEEGDDEKSARFKSLRRKNKKQRKPPAASTTDASQPTQAPLDMQRLMQVLMSSLAQSPNAGARLAAAPPPVPSPQPVPVSAAASSAPPQLTPVQAAMVKIAERVQQNSQQHGMHCSDDTLRLMARLATADVGGARNSLLMFPADPEATKLWQSNDAPPPTIRFGGNDAAWRPNPKLLPKPPSQPVSNKGRVMAEPR